MRFIDICFTTTTRRSFRHWPTGAATAYRHHFADDAQGDLFGRLGADVQTSWRPYPSVSYCLARHPDGFEVFKYQLRPSPTRDQGDVRSLTIYRLLDREVVPFVVSCDNHVSIRFYLHFGRTKPRREQIIGSGKSFPGSSRICHRDRKS